MTDDKTTRPSDVEVEAACRAYHDPIWDWICEGDRGAEGERNKMRAALAAAEKARWRPIDEAVARIPAGWTRGFVAWPGYDHGKLIDEAMCELHHAVSSGGGPKVVAYGPTIAEAVEKAAEAARRKIPPPPAEKVRCDTAPQRVEKSTAPTHILEPEAEKLP